MNSRTIMAAVAIAALLIVPIIADPDALDGDSDDGTKSYYVYGDHPIFRYHHVLGPGDTMEWTVTGIYGDLTPTIYDGGAYIQIDVSDQGNGPVIIHQKVSNQTTSDDDTVYVYPLHIGNRTYSVTFMDGGTVFDRQYIDHTTVVEVGKNHVIMPSDPTKVGYSFEGWYADADYTQRFDPTQPIRGDTIVYAKWVASGSDPGSGSDKEIIIKWRVQTYVVTFQTTAGLECKVIPGSSGASTVSFSVGVVGGYQLKDGTLSVTSDYGNLSFDGQQYTLSGINRDIIVTIDGETSQIGSDVGGNDCDFPWWIILLIILIAIIVILVIWWRYRNRDEDAEEQSVGTTEAALFGTVQDGGLSDGLREEGSEDTNADDLSENKD